MPKLGSDRENAKCDNDLSCHTGIQMDTRLHGEDLVLLDLQISAKMVKN